VDINIAILGRIVIFWHKKEGIDREKSGRLLLRETKREIAPNGVIGIKKHFRDKTDYKKHVQ
jgi:hypothetical protein